MLRYAIRNVLHYRSKYGIAFALIACLAFCLALALFAFNGFWIQAGVYARSWGDIAIWADPAGLDRAEPKGGWPEGEAPSQKIERGWPAYFRDEVKATKVVAAAFFGGDGFNKAGRWNFTAMSLEKAQALAEVSLSEGAMPGEGEALVPAPLRRSLGVGDAITFVYKNRDLILNSLTFRISGFYLPTSTYSNYLYLSEAQFAALDEGRTSDVFFVFLPGMGGKRLFLTQPEYQKINDGFRAFLQGLTGPSLHPNTGFETAKDRYAQSREIIEFFELIFSIFLIALVVIALATIVNVLFITLVDRIRIIGTFMAYGMTRRRAILVVSSEMLVFALAACTAGILAALLAAGPASSLRFTADNWTITLILGGKRSLTIEPSWWAVGATYLAGTILPFAAAAFAAAKMLKGEIVGLLHYAK
jgi:hypothetical protein